MATGGSTDWKAVVGGGLMSVVSVAGLVAVTTAFLGSPAGQRIDETALRGARIGQSRTLEHALSLLHLVSGVGLVIATLGIALLACTRRRLDLAAGAVVIVGGANISTQLLKYELVERPNVGIDTYTVNSLPSGHTTVAVSLAVALVLVAPTALRGLSAIAGTVVATLMGVATLAAGWHRPSDAVAAVLVVGAWTGVVGAALAWYRSRQSRLTAVDADEVAAAVPRTGATRFAGSRPGIAALALLMIGGVVLLGLAGVALLLTSRLSSIPSDRSDLLVAYAGGSAGIGGTVALLLVGVLALAHSAPTSRATPDTRSEISVSAKPGGW